jgi:hypothetical protein
VANVYILVVRELPMYQLPGIAVGRYLLPVDIKPSVIVGIIEQPASCSLYYFFPERFFCILARAHTSTTSAFSLKKLG